MRVGPFTAGVLLKKKYLIFHFFLIWSSLIVGFVEFWLYFRLLYFQHIAHFYIFLPIYIFFIYISVGLTSILFAKILLIITHLFHKPREGIFIRDRRDKDYRYWCIRNTIKKFPIWISHKFPIPFMDNLCFKVFGVKTNLSNSLFEGWVDTEFIELGKNVIIGKASIIQSSLILGNLLLIKKVTFEDNVSIGAHSIVVPGTYIKRNTILASNSMTTVDQVLVENFIYIGIPAHKYKPNVFQKEDLEEFIGDIKQVEELREKYEQIYVKRYDKEMSQNKENPNCVKTSETIEKNDR